MSIGATIVRRILWTIPLLLLVMLATFALLRGAGGTAFRPPEGYAAPPIPIQNRLTDFYHLDQPWYVEFGVYVRNVFTFHFGPSMLVRDLDVTDVIRRSFPVTLELVGLAAAWAIPIGILLGLLAATRRNSIVDLLATSSGTLFLVVPVFFLSFVLYQYPVVRWGLLPSGWSSPQSKILPAFTLGLAPAGYVARLIRAAAVETMEEDFVRTARAKGLRQLRIVGVHVLRNSLTPFLSAAMPMLALLVTGAFFVERSFHIPGASPLFLQAAETRDYPMLLGLSVALTVLVAAANLVSDVLLVLADPRVREAGS